MRFYTTQHRFYCGIDLHARTMHVCILDHTGSVVFDRNLPCHFDSLLQAIAPILALAFLALLDQRYPAAPKPKFGN